jgi:hypothetical protein
MCTYHWLRMFYKIFKGNVTKNSMLDEGNTIWVGHKRGPNTYDPYPQATIGLRNKVSASSNKVPQDMLKGKGSLRFCRLSAWTIVPSISCAPLSVSHAIVLGTQCTVPTAMIYFPIHSTKTQCLPHFLLSHCACMVFLLRLSWNLSSRNIIS